MVKQPNTDILNFLFAHCNHQADDVIPKLLDPVQDADTVDGANELQRTADRPGHLFALYPIQVILKMVNFVQWGHHYM